MNLNLKVIERPAGPWVDRLRRGNWVFLVKEQRFARIEWAYEEEPGCITGRVSLIQHGNNYSHTWFISKEGNGLDGKQLFAPVENNLPEAPDPLLPPPYTRLQQEVAELRDQVTRFDRLFNQIANRLLNRTV